MMIDQWNSSLAVKWNRLGTFSIGTNGGYAVVSTENGQVDASAVRWLPVN